MISATLGYLLLAFHVVFELTRDKKKIKNLLYYWVNSLMAQWSHRPLQDPTTLMTTLL